MAAFKRIGVLGHPMRPATAPVAERIAGYLQSRGAEAWCCGQWDDPQITDQVRDSDMVIAIGGDGSMLRASRVCARYGVPVLGVNMGHLGFLTEISEAEDWKQALGSVLRGDYWIEARMMIHAALLRAGLVLAEGDALNDVVISRQAATHMILLETYIDKDWATTYNADALIIATATGSTAYALACGGPILPPELRNILIVPVAPHLSMDRPIVLAEGATVEVVAAADNTAAIVLSLDGVLAGQVQPGDTIRIQASDSVSRFVRLRERNYFYRSLLDRLEPRLPVRAEPERKQI
ncbi:MAG: NAD(+)/NADH kinase [Chloroflexi bacterium]|nr:NAD(+)/NADH kinase [Chloroflexota bacterium]MDL1884859.1 NAD(+)/NADH kinase [Anaerolineae bacterium CFX8]